MHFEMSIVTVTSDFLFCFCGVFFQNFMIKPFWIKGILTNFFPEDNLGITCRKIAKKEDK